LPWQRSSFRDAARDALRERLNVGNWFSSFV